MNLLGITELKAAYVFLSTRLIGAVPAAYRTSGTAWNIIEFAIQYFIIALRSHASRFGKIN